MLPDKIKLYQRIFEITQNPFCVVNEHDLIIWCNQAFSNLVQEPLPNIIGCSSWTGYVHQQDLSPLLAAKENVLSERQVKTNQFEFRISPRDGQTRYLLGCVDLLPEDKLFIVSMTDITNQKLLEKQIRKNTLYDPLTGLANMSLFQDRIKQVLETFKSNPKKLFAVLCVDLHRFRLINESLGYQTGDLLLQKIARKLKVVLGQKHSPARLSSDKFGVLLTELPDFSEAALLAERVKTALNSKLIIEKQLIHTACSIGLVLAGPEYNSADELIRDAEIAANRAKQKGKNAITAFKPSMHKQAMRFLQLEAELRRGLEKNEFSLYYQPLISLGNLELIGFEALIRWISPKGVIISPSEFIPVAEETEMIIPIGKWVLEQACQQLTVWQKQFPNKKLIISLNLSTKQFKQSDIIYVLENIIQQSKINPDCLKLEITETVVMQDAKQSSHLLHKMKELGVQIAIDDFGTGYSSLSYLQRFPIDYLKIDRAFISNLTPEHDNYPLVKAIITLAHNLNLEVIAEGIEKKGQIAILTELGCEYGQGFYFAKPLPLPEAEQLIQSDTFPVNK